MNSDRWVSVEFLCDLLLDENQPITERFRAFGLRLVGHPSAINSLIKAMRDDSTLLAYEAAYKLGQTRKPDAIPALKAVVEDLSLHPIVRLKAAESLGAFGLETSVPVLETSFKSDPSQEVRDTCELALTRIRELKNATPDKLVYFKGFEPAPPVFRPIPELREVLLNEDKSLYGRCSALFTLRLLCLWPTGDTEEAFSAIIESLGAESPILRHHIAYCLAQLGDKKAFHALSLVLRNASEHPMVRLKAVDALHSIAHVEGLGSTTYCECIELLKEFSKDPDPIVSQSCEVALRRLDCLGTNLLFEHIPVEFWKSNCLNKKTSVNLRDPSGKKWSVELKFHKSAGNNRTLMTRGWKQFYESNKLKIGDVCTFELNHNPKGSTVASVDVHIFPASN